MVRLIMLVYFFFQAEDGIRDSSVTGVQTCALPISPPRCRSPAARAARASRADFPGACARAGPGPPRPPLAAPRTRVRDARGRVPRRRLRSEARTSELQSHLKLV